MERVGDRQGKMERCYLTGQSPQRAVAPMEEEEDSSAVEFVDEALQALCYSGSQDGAVPLKYGG